MKSFELKGLIQKYFELLFQTDKIWNSRRIILNLFFPSLISWIILSYLSNLSNLVDLVAIILSILVGLLFSFVSGFSDRIRSEHLSQKASDKLVRLKLIEETSNGAFVTMFLSLVALFLLVLLAILSNFRISLVSNNNCIKVLSTTIVIVVVYQIFMMLIYMINRLHKLIKVDIDQEVILLQKQEEDELNEWENYD